MNCLRVRLMLPAMLAALTLTPAPSEADFGLYALSGGSLNSGTISAIDGSGNATSIVQIPNNSPGTLGLAVDPSGNFYVSGFTGVEKYSSTGQDLGAIAGLSTLAEGIAVDRAGNLYVAEYNNNLIEKFSPTGQDLGVFATGLSLPKQLAFDSSGNLYALNKYGGVQEFSASGRQVGGFAVEPAYAMAVDPGGNVYISTFFIANGGNQVDEILKFSSTGQALGTFALTDSGQAQALAFDASGNLYAAYPLGFVEKYSPSGQDLGNFSSVSAVALAFGPSVVPEPASLVMLGAGLMVALGFARLRRRRAIPSA